VKTSRVPVQGAPARLAGLYVSFSEDLPTNQTIAVVACAILAAAVAVHVTVKVVATRLPRGDAVD